MTEANLWPSWLSHIYCLHSSGEVCTQFQEKNIYLTTLGATYTSPACKQFNDKPVLHSSRLRWMLGTAFIGCRVSNYKTSGMLHHLGMSLSECKSNSCVGDHTCWHAAIYPVGCSPANVGLAQTCPNNLKHHFNEDHEVAMKCSQVKLFYTSLLVLMLSAVLLSLWCTSYKLTQSFEPWWVNHSCNPTTVNFKLGLLCLLQWTSISDF